MAHAMSLSSVASPLLSQKTWYSAVSRNNKNVITPCLATFPSRSRLRNVGVRAEAGAADNKDTSLDVRHVNKSDNQGTALESQRRQRRTPTDISSFGN